jgi:hypothetical protein
MDWQKIKVGSWGAIGGALHFSHRRAVDRHPVVRVWIVFYLPGKINCFHRLCVAALETGAQFESLSRLPHAALSGSSQGSY